MTEPTIATTYAVRRQALSALRLAHGAVTAQDMAGCLNTSLDAAYALLGQLAYEGSVRRVPPGRYELTTRGQMEALK